MSTADNVMTKVDTYKSIEVKLEKQEDLTDNLLMPCKFVVLIDDITWPEESLGIELGNAVKKNIRYSK
jgi:hypothetical protein